MTTASSKSRHPWLRRAALALAVTALSGGVALRIAQRRSDGPLNDIVPGGALRAGELAPLPSDWTRVLGGAGNCANGECSPMKPVELELVGPGTSRWVGIMVRDGVLYLPCDLGFMWGRFSGTNRLMLHAIYLFKHWHEDALGDGRVALRIGGKRYEGQAVRVTDADLETALRAQLEQMARQWVAPEPLAAAPTEEPNDIWFFRVDPTPSAE